MKKLTKKEYVEDLNACNSFVRCIHGMSAEQLKEKIDELGYQTFKDAAVYEYESVTVRSKDFVFNRKDRDPSYRDFMGQNEYYTHKGVLLHQNTKDGHTCTFINC